MAQKNSISLVGRSFMVFTLASLLFMIVASETAAAQSEAKTLKIGCGQSLTVPAGLEARKCHRLIVDDINKSGGIVIKGQKYNLEMIIYDDKYTSEGGRAAAERLVHRDKVKFVVGEYASTPIMGALTVTEAAKILTFTGGISDAIVSAKHKYNFRSNAIMGPLLKWNYITKVYPNAKKVLHLGADNETGHSRGRFLDKVAKAYNLEVVKHIYAAPNTQDYSSIAASIAAISPDIVDTTGGAGGADDGLILKALYQNGVRKPVVNDFFNEPDVIAVCGKEAAEGLITLYSDTTEMPNPPPLAAKVRKMYEEKYGSWNQAGLNWTSSLYLFLAVIQKANSLETEEIFAALKDGLVYDTYAGKSYMIKRPDKGNMRYVDTLMPSAIAVYHNGEIVPKVLCSVEDALETVEKVFGYPGQWK